MGKDNAGPAFPSQIRNDGEKPIVGFLHEEIHAGTTSNYAGMSLRDYFAVRVYAASIAGGYWPIDSSREDQARMAYLHADALLAERAK